MMTRLLIADEKQGLGVPYNGYVDLKRNPERISELSEINGWQELENFLRVVNQPDSLFRTLRVDVSASSINHSGFTKKVTCYVTIAFEILEWNRPKGTFEDLYKFFLQYTARYSTPNRAVVEFELIPTSYNDHKVNAAWSLDVWSTGLGNSEDEARGAWYSGLQIVQDFLEWQSTLYRNELKRGRKTIS
jgi:hypothetical protein